MKIFSVTVHDRAPYADLFSRDEFTMPEDAVRARKKQKDIVLRCRTDYDVPTPIVVSCAIVLVLIVAVIMTP